MPIKFQFKKVPIDESGKAYDSLEAFQKAQIADLLKPGNACGLTPDDCAMEVMANKAEIIEILQLTMDARPTARGVRKPRKGKFATVPATGQPITKEQIDAA